MIRGIASALLVVGMLALTSPTATAQEYGESLGDLEDVPASAVAGESIPMRGSGFAAASILDVSLIANATGEIILLGTVTVGADGTINTSVVIPADVDRGFYTLSAAGTAVDGGSRILSAGLEVVESTPSTTASTSPPTTLVMEEESLTAASSEEPSDEGSPLPFVVAGVVLLAAAIGGIAWWRSRSVSS